MLLEDLIECCDGKSNPIKFFSADQIIEATNNFSESNLVSGLYDYEYDWYSGKSEKHPMLLIKKAHSVYEYYQKDFCRDIAISSMVSGHKNFLKLVGCCLDSKVPAMVYDGVKKHYKLDLREQPWKRRMKTAEDISTALAYLHTAFPRPFVYKSMGLEKILLDEDGVAKLFDFAYCISIPEGETFVHEDRIVGTYDYLEPRYMLHGEVSEKTDVFAIGIVMQNLLSGKERFNKLRTMDAIADPEILEKMGEISEEELCRMKAFLVLSERCIGLRGEVPTMVEVAKELRKIQRSLKNVSSSPLGETHFDTARDVSSSVLSNQTLKTKALLTSIACQVFDEMFQWVIYRWFRFFRKSSKNVVKIS